jgi:hypothetical protein
LKKINDPQNKRNPAKLLEEAYALSYYLSKQELSKNSINKTASIKKNIYQVNYLSFSQMKLTSLSFISGNKRKLTNQEKLRASQAKSYRIRNNEISYFLLH